MSSTSMRKHAGTGAARDQPSVPEPSLSEQARTLVHWVASVAVRPFARTFPVGSDTRLGDAVAPQARAFLLVPAPE